MEGKRKIHRCFKVLMVVMTFLLIAGCSKKNDGVPDCVVSNHSSDGDYSLIIIANQDEIDDKEAFAKSLIEKVRNNDFKTIMFSYDEIGYPTRLQMSVYLSEEEWQDRETDPFMKVSFTQEDRINNAYNIVENYEKFELKIE